MSDDKFQKAYLDAMAAKIGLPQGDGDITTYEHSDGKLASLWYSSKPVIFVNGMSNSPTDHAASALATSYIRMCPVIGVYNKTNGGFSDFLQCIGDKISLSPSDPRKLLVKLLERSDRESILRTILRRNPAQIALFDLLRGGKHGSTTVVAHSQGNLILANVLTAISIVDGQAGNANRKIESFGSPTYYWPDGINREENAFTFDPVSWLGGIDLTFAVSKVGMPSGSLNPITHGFLEYVKRDATFFVNRYRWGSLGMTFSMDEAGLAKALADVGTNFQRVKIIFDYLDRKHNNDSDDVARDYITYIKTNGVLARLKASNDPLKDTLRNILGTGLVTSSDKEAMRALGYNV
jgi:hypothetical protein